MANFVESRVRVLKQQKNRHSERLMCVESSGAQCPQAGVVKKLGEWSACSGVSLHDIVKRDAKDHHNWNYEEKTGPKHWPEMFKKCGGSRQSPIDIQNSEVDLNDELDAFEFDNYDDPLEDATIENNGHTVQISPGPKDAPRIIDEGGMDDKYQFLQLHFHWGSDSKKGSEHLIDGQRFPLEMHFVHMNTNYKTKEKASTKEDGLAVLAVLFKIVNELEAELSNSDLNVDRLSELVEILCIKFEPLTLIDQQMEPLFKPEEFDAEFEIAEKYREKTTLSQSQDEHFRNSDNIRIKVPKYHITRFYGDDASKWLTFWNSFETAVHNNESLNKVDKFNYLKAHLGGSALNTVEGFPISAKPYDEAVELLKNRFANPEILIQANMNKILSLQPLKNSNDLRSFRKFVDNCNVQLRSLNSLGVPSANYGKILCPMLLKLIPSDLVLDYHKLQQKDSGSDIQQLLSFLTQSLTAREQTYTTNKSSFELCNRIQETKSNFSREPRSYKQQNQKSFHTCTINKVNEVEWTELSF
ncbi:carbonic anhydrase 2 [Trichonephila clavipes]|nr:carbonic anhydrase 2 [Trichonephila clavipes]